MKKNTEIKLAAIYWQTSESGWAYNLIDVNGDHTSDGFEITTHDDGTETWQQVLTVFLALCPECSTFTWTPDGDGYEGRP